ncbi:MAG: adenylosuccinate lyase [Halobacteriovoraceae bacterium]|nr:adenylosuccinate lyase [Halobacteriovoraceae bacterium]
MIPRYDCPEISSIWDEEYKFTQYLKVELALMKALESQSFLPEGTSKQILEKVKINPQRIQEIEKEVHHDVIAFCTSITEQLNPSMARFFHFGATSSDIIDTATNLQVKESLQKILKIYHDLLLTIWNKVEETKNILAMGRSHGINAEPLIFSQKFLSFFSELARSYIDLSSFYQSELTAQFSGAVGSYTVLNHEIERLASEFLGLPTETVSSQVIPRDRFAKMVSIIARAATGLERLAVEIRHWQHSDINEAAEGFSKNQKGSSTMPHKKNPISSENITGMARMLRSYLVVAYENIVLWHERDISHSSTERLYLPDCLGLFYYALNRMNQTVQNLVVNREIVEHKVKNSSVFLSSFYLHELLKSTDERREDLYRYVQESSFAVMEGEEKDLKTALCKKIEKAKDLPQMGFEELKSKYLKSYEVTKKRVSEEFKIIWQ